MYKNSCNVKICSLRIIIDVCNDSQFSGYKLQTAQSWANAGVTEDGHCQGACRPQWFFYVPIWDGTDINSPQCWEPDLYITTASTGDRTHSTGVRVVTRSLIGWIMWFPLSTNHAGIYKIWLPQCMEVFVYARQHFIHSCVINYR